MLEVKKANGEINGRLITHTDYVYDNEHRCYDFIHTVKAHELNYFIDSVSYTNDCCEMIIAHKYCSNRSIKYELIAIYNDFTETTDITLIKYIVK